MQDVHVLKLTALAGRDQGSEFISRGGRSEHGAPGLRLQLCGWTGSRRRPWTRIRKGRESASFGYDAAGLRARIGLDDAYSVHTYGDGTEGHCA
jgi:hypothetical protein